MYGRTSRSTIHNESFDTVQQLVGLNASIPDPYYSYKGESYSAGPYVENPSIDMSYIIPQDDGRREDDEVEDDESSSPYFLPSGIWDDQDNDEAQPRPPPSRSRVYVPQQQFAPFVPNYEDPEDQECAALTTSHENSCPPHRTKVQNEKLPPPYYSTFVPNHSTPQVLVCYC